MKKQKRKLNVKRIILLISLIIILIWLYQHFSTVLLGKVSDNFNTLLSNSDVKTEYEVIKQDYNKNYLGKGQQDVSKKDGYFTTFTTEEGKNKKVYKEYKQNGNASWSNKSYWGGTMAENGCGITAIATILSGYNKKVTPENLRLKYYPVLDNTCISKELSNTYGIKNSDFFYDKIHLSNKNILEHLKSNRPILICVWNKPTNNRWTTASHYMALLATDGSGMVYVSNPNGLENTSKSSGWYDIDEITPYLAKVLYIESYK